MPLSKKRDRERKRAERAAKKKAGTALMPKALLKKLHRLGIDPRRYLSPVPVSLDDYRDLQRRLEGKTERVKWQSSRILKLMDEIATVKALVATLPAMQDSEVLQRLTEVLQRLTQVEAEQALQAAQRAQEPQETSLDAVHRLAYTLHPEWNRKVKDGN